MFVAFPRKNFALISRQFHVASDHPDVSLFLSICILAFSNGAAGTLLALKITEAGFSSLSVGLISSGYFFGMIVGPFYVQRLVTHIGYIRAFSAFGSTLSDALILHLSSSTHGFGLFADYRRCVHGRYVYLH